MHERTERRIGGETKKLSKKGFNFTFWKTIHQYRVIDD